MRRQDGRRYLALLCLLLAVACSTTRTDPSATEPSGRNAKTPSKGSGVNSDNAKFSFRHVANLRLDKARAIHVAVFDNDVAVTAATSRTLDHPDSVWVARLPVGPFREVASTGYGARGVVDWAEGSGDWIVYTDESHEPSDQDLAVNWQLKAVNLTSGQRLTIASSAGLTPAIPVPKMGDGYVVWSQLVNVTAGANLHLYDLARHHDTVIVQHERASSAGISNGRVVYDDLTTSDQGQQLRDVYSVDLRGADRKQLSHSGQAVLPRIGSGNVVWQEPLNADPERLMMAGVDGNAPATLVTDSPGLGNAVTADGVVYFLDRSDGIIAMRPGGSPVAVTPIVSVPLRISADRNLVAYGLIIGDRSPSEYVQIRVDRIAS